MLRQGRCKRVLANFKINGEMGDMTRKRARRNAIRPRSAESLALFEFSVQHRMNAIKLDLEEDKPLKRPRGNSLDNTHIEPQSVEIISVSDLNVERSLEPNESLLQFEEVAPIINDTPE